jgi:hypothetical protein
MRTIGLKGGQWTLDAAQFDRFNGAYFVKTPAGQSEADELAEDTEEDDLDETRSSGSSLEQLASICAARQMA